MVIIMTMICNFYVHLAAFRKERATPTSKGLAESKPA
jgi:hypothetical protein